MKVRIGEVLEHGDQKFIIIDIKHQATMDGVVLILTAYDPSMADKEQQKAIKVDQISTQVIDFIKKATESGGFSIGGQL